MDDITIYLQLTKLPPSNLCKFNFRFDNINNDVITLDPNYSYTIALKKAYLPSILYNLTDCWITVEYEGEKITLNFPSDLYVSNATTFATQCTYIFESAEIADLLSLEKSPISLKLYQSRFTLTCKSIQSPYKLTLSENLSCKLGFTQSSFHCNQDSDIILKTSIKANPSAGQERILISCNLCKPNRFNSLYLPILQSISIPESSLRRLDSFDFADPLYMDMCDMYNINNIEISLLDESSHIIKCNRTVMKSILFVIVIRKNICFV